MRSVPSECHERRALAIPRSDLQLRFASVSTLFSATEGAQTAKGGNHGSALASRSTPEERNDNSQGTRLPPVSDTPVPPAR